MALASLEPLFIAGSTAVGKSAVALELARRLDGEIISVDSMQVYRGMDVGTAKPSAAERDEIPHHLIDVVELTQEFDVAAFLKLAAAAVRAIQGRNRLPIFCGGTGLYFQVYLEGLGEAPSSDQAIRTELLETPLPNLLEELRRTDPVSFDRIDPSNRRRVVRALEVIRLTGRPFSEQRAPWNRSWRDSAAPPAGEAPAFFALERDRADLRKRIDQRIDAMFDRGLILEVQQLLAHGLAKNKTALQALGYRQVADALRTGAPLEETAALVKQRTWQFAKRQMTWFRRQIHLTWIAVGESDPPETVAKMLESRYLRRGLASS